MWKLLKKIIICTAIIVISIAAFGLIPSTMTATCLFGPIPVNMQWTQPHRYMLGMDEHKVQAELDRLANIINRYEKSSELSQLNEHAHSKWQLVSDELWDILYQSKKWYENSNGLFDPTVGPLIRLWMHAGKRNKLPSQSQINQTVESMGYHHVRFNAKKQVQYEMPFIHVDLGGISKGWAVEKITAIFQKKGIKSGFIEAGGDSRAFGDKAFVFGIQDPTAKERILARLPIVNQAIVTSGNYERFSIIKNQRYSHIINPKTGIPTDSDMISLTVIGPNAMDADALATIGMLLNSHELAAFFEKFNAYSVIGVYQNHSNSTLIISQSLKKLIQIAPRWNARISWINSPKGQSQN